MNPKYWVARDADGTLGLFGLKPVRSDNQWVEKGCSYIEELDGEYFPDLQWKHEPARCTLVRDING